MLERPPMLPMPKTCIYKTTGNTKVHTDVYLPATLEVACPVMLFIHGGGWLGGSRSEFCRPLFHHFISLDFIVASMDYRLLPETSFSGQLEDVRDMEFWLRHSLPFIFTDPVVTVDADRVIVVGASAGAQLALLTPKIWEKKPKVILALYGPTNMHSIPCVKTTRFSQWPVQHITPDLLNDATTFETPPTEISPPKNEKDNMKARSVLAREIFSKGLVAPFLINGLPRNESGELKLPGKNSASKEEIDAISPLQLLQNIDYPSVCQVTGDCDDIFDNMHVHNFHKALEHRGVRCKKIIATGKGHAFDIREPIGSKTYETIIHPAVTWVVSELADCSRS